ncbi:hypothetical protein QQF64_033117 [Cirrhinus molitorella]|uniref:Uncharacterized protein n=1 Tax=Cirrhinus molitorella TaxID=172907 RepID=A0ABR3MSZ4_9TELE
MRCGELGGAVSRFWRDCSEGQTDSLLQRDMTPNSSAGGVPLHFPSVQSDICKLTTPGRRSSVKLITAVRRALAPTGPLVEWNHKWHKQGLARS